MRTFRWIHTTEWSRELQRRRIESERLVLILERLRGLLLKYDFVDQATIAAELIDLAHLRSAAFVERISGGEVWGSAGSMADVIGLRGYVERPEDEMRRDSREYTRLLIDLADKMKAQGIASERSDFVADAFRRGLERRGNSR